MISSEQIYDTLHQHFGFDHFRPGQLAALANLAAGRDTLAVLPTGAGKTLIYELYGVATGQLVLVISPLISLMLDQVTALNMRGEKRAAALTSMMSWPERHWVINHLSAYRFLFVSPEMLTQDQVLAAIRQAQPGLLVVDEAHCISTWGPDFRPEYLLLGQLRHQLGDPLTLMTTATATKRVQADIKGKMQLPQAADVIESIDRPNIYLDVERFEAASDKDEWLVTLVSQLKKPGVIYFSSKKKANEVAELLNAKTDRRVAAYHADLDSETRFKVQQQFMLDQLDVICATSAFGMGIDKDNIRFVIHYHLPSDLESYWQEIGRAGRDGQQSVAILLYLSGDEQLTQFLIDNTVPQPEEIDYYYRHEPNETSDEKASLVWFYKQHHYTVAQIQAGFDKRRGQRVRALSQLMTYVRTPECKREFVQVYFGQPKQAAVDWCCSNDNAGLDIAGLGLQADAETTPTKAVDDWHGVLAQLFKIG